MNKTTIEENSSDLIRGIDHIGVSAYAVIHDGHGSILLMKRGPKARDEQGSWDICGGAIEFGESIDEAVCREVLEELCCEVLDLEYLITYDAHRILNGRRTHWVAIVHTARVNPDEIQIGEPEKIAEIGWFTKKTLPKKLHSQFGKTLSKLVASKIIK